MRNPFAKGNRVRLIVYLVVAAGVSQLVRGRPGLAVAGLVGGIALMAFSVIRSRATS